MIPYILYSSFILTACFIFYKLLLQKETFFQLNRFVLLGCMMLAFILPVIPIPQQLSLRKSPLLENTTPLVYSQRTGNNETTVNEKIAGIDVSPGLKSSPTSLLQVMQWLVYLYWFGVAIFGLNFLMQAGVLLYKAYSREAIKDGRFRIVEIAGDKAPCSFGNNIYINPAKYDWQTYSEILLHEKIHIEQKHTLDLMLAEIVLIFQWFNPFAWFWRKDLENNLEFFTDNKLLKHNSLEKASYQVSLVKVAAPHFPLSLTTNYNQSQLKKRLLMMNAKKSNVHTIWKYFFLIPLMILFVCLFNEPVAISQTDPKPKAKVSNREHNSHDITTEGSWFATIKDDKINFQFKNNNGDNSSNGNSFLLSEFGQLPKGTNGTFTLPREAGMMEFMGKFDGDKGMGQYKFTPNKDYSAYMYKEGVDVNEDTDDMVFFLVDIKRSYVQMLKQNGYSDLDKDKLVPLAALDVNEGYIKSIKAAGFSNIGLDNLVPFRALGISKDYIDEIRNAGYKDVTPDKVITFKAQGIDGKYIADFRNSVKHEDSDDNDNENLNDNNNDNDQGSADNKNLHNNKHNNSNRGHEKNRGGDGKDDDDIIAFKAMNIDNDYINSFKKVGYTNLSNSDLISMKALGITSEYAKSIIDAGFTHIKADELVSLKAQNVTPALIKQYRALGFNNVSLDDIISAKATGTSPSFISSMKQKGHDMKTLDKYVALRAVLGD